jgi:hypothetical protein
MRLCRHAGEEAAQASSPTIEHTPLRIFCSGAERPTQMQDVRRLNEVEEELNS